MNTTTTWDTADPSSAGRVVPRTGPSRPRREYWTAAFVVITGLLAMSPASRLLLFGFPILATLLAVHLYRSNRPRYVEFVCWLWFLTPLVRRLVDYRSGGLPATAVLLAPVLAISLPALWLLADWRRLLQRQLAPLLCLLAICAYATILGLLNFAPRLVLQDLLTWLAPLAFAFMLYRHREEAADLYRAFERAFLYGMLLVSGYGLLQFFFLPRWDSAWMEQMQLASLGVAEPGKLRVFSTMNAPQILASFLVVGLLFAFNSHRRIRFVGIPLSLLCLVLSLARSGWVALVGGVIYLLLKLPRRQKLHFIVAALLSTVVFIFALQNPDLQQVIEKRFQTVSTIADVRNDGSFRDRVDGYRAVFTSFIDDPFGLGMGATPAIAEDTTGTVGFVHGGQSLVLADSTIVMVLTTMGFAGGLLLLCALVPLGRTIFYKASVQPAYTRTIRAVLIAMLAEAALNGIISGPTGFLTWASVGFCLALGISTDKLKSPVREERITAPFSPALERL